MLAGLGAGVVNTAVGSGSLITYPVLLLAGLPPVIANVTNTVGLAPGALAGAWAFRRELGMHKTLLWRLVPIAAVGAVGGGALLLVLPSEAFQLIVPVLIIAAALLVAVQPILLKRARQDEGKSRSRGVALGASVFGASVYGGYFSAAQGIILLGLFGLFMPRDVQAQNALKNLLQAIVNVVAAGFFLITATVNLLFVLAVALGSLVGAPLGAWLARRTPPSVFRAVVAVFGCAVGVYLLIWG